MKLIVVHYHLRPGGVRRVIELATPHIPRRMGFSSVVLATGEAPDPAWLRSFEHALAPTPVKVVVQPTLRYFSEQRGDIAVMRRKLRVGVGKILVDDCLVWAHNLGLGRNLLLTRELVRVCEARGIRLIAHQHDWWFENRWQRWPELRRCGFRTRSAVAEAVFPAPVNVVHATINRADAAILARHFPKRAQWLPNPAERATPPSLARMRKVRLWLRKSVGADAPVWLLPCRLLRRKNIAEALLLTRWLRPEAWLVTTGGISSADETAYAAKLTDAARSHRWPLRLGVLAGDESSQPSVAELMAASEAVLLTSLQEGFGFTAIEAAAAERPLIARRLPNVLPDLDEFGFRFPQAYDEIWIAPELFDWKAERRRQVQGFREWLRGLPRAGRALAALPTMLSLTASPRPIPFSRLTLPAQIEVLSTVATESWSACAPLNPTLRGWKRRAAAGSLQVTPWPRAGSSLSGEVYVERFAEIARAQPRAAGSPSRSVAAQEDFMKARLATAHGFPLLWSPTS